MSFDYDKIREKRDSQSYWATSSDLFMVMSLVFLMLYVVAGLRTSTFSIEQATELKRVSELNEDLKQQLKVYNTLKENYLETKASNEDMEVYESLMAKLDILKGETKDDQQKIKEQLNEAKQKEQALNQYQQIVRNIINSNVMAKATIQRRAKQLSKVRLEKEQLSSRFKDIESNLKKTKSDLSKTQKSLSDKRIEREKLVAQLSESQASAEAKMKELKQQYQAQQQQERQQYEAKLQNQKLTAKQKEKALNRFIAKQQNDLNEQLEEQSEKYQERISNLSGSLKASKGELEKAKARLNARRQLAGMIKDNFAKAGIDAKVDPRTGDVELNFGNEYFDTGKYDLKPGMTQILNKSIPIYAKSLFEDEKIAGKLSFVEIVGFASPTYRGKYIDPQSMREEDRKAINYNLNLSYYRARSIFDYVFDRKKLSYANQKQLRSLVKVSGRSFLAEKVGEKDRKVASGMSRRQFCKIYDCLKAQKVIIKFDLED